MFTRIDGMPAGAIGFEASGAITPFDRRTMLEPTIDTVLAEGGKIRG